MSNTQHIRSIRRRLVARGALLVLASAGATWQTAAQTREREVLLGGLFSLTGNWSTLGQASKAAMELAIDDVNRYLTGNAAGVRFVAAIEDTRLDPALALDKARAMQRRGVQLLIGPQSSAEVERLKPFVDRNDVLLVSPSSTAGSLAIVGDNVFRLAPTDSLEGVAISKLMWEDGIRAIIPIWRGDPGSAGLERATRTQFTALGGEVLTGVKYAVERPDFANVLADAKAELRRAIDRHGVEAVAVYLTAFDESVPLLELAARDPIFGTVRWYGDDAIAQSEALLANPRAVDFAIRTRFANPIFGLEEGAQEIWGPLSERIRSRIGRNPDAYALAVYDAVWVVARAYIASGATRDIAKLKHAFTIAASTGYGATGWTILDQAGDRKHGDYDFWAIRVIGDSPRWVRIARYEARTKLLIRLAEQRVAEGQD